jgi:hypothetical protein
MVYPNRRLSTRTQASHQGWFPTDSNFIKSKKQKQNERLEDSDNWSRFIVFKKSGIPSAFNKTITI